MSHRRSRKKGIIIFLTIILMLIVVSVAFIVGVANPIVASYSKMHIKDLSEKAVNSAMIDVLSTYAFEELINYEKNSSGDIVYIEADYFKINKIIRDILDKSYNNVQVMSLFGFGLPIGTFTGISFLSGKGPIIKLKIVPIGAVSSNLKSKFVSAGINNTKHSIYANIEVNTNIVLPIKSYTVKTTTQVLLCENMIFGKIPEVYFQSGSLNEMLNLIP